MNSKKLSSTTPMWFALLGREWRLAAAELATVTGDATLSFAAPFVTGTCPTPAWDNLGGVIRAGTALGRFCGTLDELVVEMIRHLPTSQSKLVVGLSAPQAKSHDYARLCKAFKQATKEQGLSLRLVRSQRDTTLNSGELEHNRVFDKGLELMVWQDSTEAADGDQKTWIIGRSDWQQDVADFKSRDHDRPARDARVGMLPPKLALMLLNLAGVSKDTTIYDPFCGTGVVLQEALRLGHPIAGSDLAEAMVRATKQNLAWFAAQRHLDLHTFLSDINEQDARSLKLPTKPVAIVGEGWLGDPHLTGSDPGRLQKEAQMLSGFYRQVLTHWRKLPGIETIVLGLPVWFHGHPQKEITLPLLDDLESLGYDMEQFAPFNEERLTYHRPGQTVGRMIVRLRKTS